MKRAVAAIVHPSAIEACAPDPSLVSIRLAGSRLGQERKLHGGREHPTHVLLFARLMIRRDDQACEQKVFLFARLIIMLRDAHMVRGMAHTRQSRPDEEASGRGRLGQHLAYWLIVYRSMQAPLSKHHFPNIYDQRV